MGIDTSYIRGFFDEEGTIDAKRRSLDITNTNLSILEEIRVYLCANGIRARIRRHSMSKLSPKRCYRLIVGGFHNVVRFKNLIGTFDQSRQCKPNKIISSYKYVPFSDEEVERIQELRREGLTFEKIADIMRRKKVSMWAVCRRIVGRGCVSDS